MRLAFIRIEDDQHFVIRHYARPRNERVQAVSKLDRRAEAHSVARDFMNILTATPQRNPVTPQFTQLGDRFEQWGILVEEVNTPRAFPAKAPRTCFPVEPCRSAMAGRRCRTPVL